MNDQFAQNTEELRSTFAFEDLVSLLAAEAASGGSLQVWARSGVKKAAPMSWLAICGTPDVG